MTAEAFSLKQSIMTEETLTPIFKSDAPIKPIGGRVDLIAALMAGIGASGSTLAAIWFFFGFAENDSRLEHLTSAFVLTLLLFAFAIIPFSLVSRFAYSAYREGAKRTHLLWTLFLMIPWIGLGALTVTHTPLPIWCGLSIAGLAGLLCLWAVLSMILDRKAVSTNTAISQQNEMPESSK